MATRHVIGIDLGTTNCALSWRNLEEGSGDAASIPQLTAPGTIEERLLLPSFLYLAKEGEFAPGALALPWDKKATYTAGEFARVHGAKVPTRLVASAKSWLSHAGVDRTSALLPWQAPPEVERISPVEASARYLRHLAGAAEASRKIDLHSEEIILTVPASFDAAARELTTQAANHADLPNVTLLEEPQAAFYCWLSSQSANGVEALRPGMRCLVVDIGGGTSDFSLIRCV